MSRLLWVLGDSWTDPRDLDSFRRGWPQQVAAALGMGLVASGVWGAGYCNEGGEGSRYWTQAVRAPAIGADAVIVWGSVNDRGHPPDLVYEGAAETYRLIRLACPDAPLLVYGPQWWDTEPEPAMHSTRDAVRRAAEEAGALFVDPLLWFAGRADLLDGTAHPGRGGNDLIARRVIPDLLFALLPTATGPGADALGGRVYPRAYRSSRNYSPPSLPSAV